MKQLIGKVSTAPLSPALKIDNMVFLSGQFPIDLSTGKIIDGDVQQQTSQILNNIQTLLKEASCTLDDVVKVTVFLKDISDFSAMNEVYAKFFSKIPPTRSTFEVKLAVDANIEIEAIAIVGASTS